MARLVLLGIANHDGDGGAWPTLETLAVYAGGVDTRTVRRAIHQLVELGEIAVEINGGGNEHTRADRRPNRYTILLGCPPVCDRTSRHRTNDGGAKMSARPVDNSGHGGTGVSAREGHGGTSVTERGDIRDRHGRTQVSPEPSKNHPEPPARRPRHDGTDRRPVENSAGGRAAQPIDKPAAVLELERAFAARDRIRHLAPFHRLSLGDVERLVELVTRHGVDALANHAAATALTARSWRAFLGDWGALAPPARATVDEPRCTICNQTERAHSAPAFNDHEPLLPTLTGANL